MNNKPNTLFLPSLFILLGLFPNLYPVEAQILNKDNRPRIVVNIIVDQLRTDYLNACWPFFETKGFKELFSNGQVYSQAINASFKPDRASSTANLITGAVPSIHGIIGNNWFDRNTLNVVNCVEDKAFRGINCFKGYSPKKINVSTISDELKVATSGKGYVYSISPFADTSIILGGHACDGAFWIDDETGLWASSSYYMTELPLWIKSINKKIVQQKVITWTPSDERIGNYDYIMGSGVHKPFKYSFVQGEQSEEIKTSALINDFVVQAFKSCIEHTAIGTDKTPDFISVAFYAGPYKNKGIENYITELQDAYLRIDKAIAEIMNIIEEKVKKDEYLILLTSSGTELNYTEPYLEKYKIPTGIFDVQRACSLLNMYLSAKYGQGKYIQSSYKNEIYLSHKVIENKKYTLIDIVRNSIEFISQLQGVENVYSPISLNTSGEDINLKSLKKSLYANRNGDIIIQIMPGWNFVSKGYESSIVRNNFLSFPIVFYGNGVKPSLIKEETSTIAIAPTLSKKMCIRAPNAAYSKPLF